MFDYQFVDEVRNLKNRVEKLFIYGAGFRGAEIYRILKRHNIKINGFVVTEITESDIKEDLPIFKADTIIHDPNTGIVLGLSDMNTIDVVEYLKKLKVDFSKIVDGGKYLSEYRGTMDLRKEPYLELTAVLGCRVNCRFCPQSTLINAYFAEDKNRKRVLSIEDFEIILKNTPKDCVFMFAGMGEPYLNPNCTKLLQLACDAGKKVRLYTTLEGATEEDVDAMLKMPLQFVGLHVADKKGYAQITTSNLYYKMVEKLLDSKKCHNGASFLDDITAQSDPDERIVELCNGRFEIITAVQDRAGNLKDDEVEKRDGKLTDEKFVCTYCGFQVNNHVVLPDGTLLLCQMDYGMKHVLGNLFIHTYDELRKGKVMETIFEAMNGRHTCELLCDTCLYAKVIKG